ncbi:MAG: heme ABC exporter ATP-binding protein CcmA [Alphaproteobacteria bacterium]
MLRLSASGLSCIRGSRSIFDYVNLELSSGEALALVGPNGSGKSSLLRLIAGLLRPFAGRVELAGGHSEHTIGEQAHYLGHLDPLKASLTVGENLAFWVRYLGGDIAALPVALASVSLGGLADLPAAYLSAGQRRRLSLARLIAVPRPIWLLDEPTSALDAAGQERLAELMRRHLSGGGLILAATHGPLGIECKTLQLGQSAPSPLEGEGWGGGSEFVASAARQGRTPTPNPSPQGGGEQSGADGRS